MVRTTEKNWKYFVRMLRPNGHGLMSCHVMSIHFWKIWKIKWEVFIIFSCLAAQEVTMSVSRSYFRLNSQIRTTCDNLRQLVTTCNNLWKLVTTCDNLWQLATTCDNLWELVRTCHNLWELVRTCDNFWQLVTRFWHFRQKLSFKASKGAAITIFVIFSLVG